MAACVAARVGEGKATRGCCGEGSEWAGGDRSGAEREREKQFTLEMSRCKVGKERGEQKQRAAAHTHARRGRADANKRPIQPSAFCVVALSPSLSLAAFPPSHAGSVHLLFIFALLCILRLLPGGRIRPPRPTAVAFRADLVEAAALAAPSSTSSAPALPSLLPLSAPNHFAQVPFFSARTARVPLCGSCSRRGTVDATALASTAYLCCRPSCCCCSAPRLRT